MRRARLNQDVPARVIRRFDPRASRGFFSFGCAFLRRPRTLGALVARILRRVGVSDRRAHRGSRFVGQGEDPNREGTLFASSAVRFLRQKRTCPQGERREPERPRRGCVGRSGMR